MIKIIPKCCHTFEYPFAFNNWFTFGLNSTALTKLGLRLFKESYLPDVGWDGSAVKIWDRNHRSPVFLNEMIEKLSYNETDKHLCTTLCFNFAETKRTLKHNKNFPCLSFKNSNYNNYGK